MQKLLKNDEMILTIESLGANGEGIAHFNGATIFVLYALPDEEVLAHIISCKENFYIAKVVQIIKPSQNRVPAPCPYFSKCGGCDLQHLEYGSQLDYKTDLVKNTLNKYAKIDVDVLPTIHVGNEYHYRNKFAFPVSQDGEQIKIGMFRKNSHDIISIEDCLLQSSLASIIIRIMKRYMTENNISAFDEQNKSGDIKHIVVRENDGKFILTVVVANKKFNNFEPLIKLLKDENLEFGLYKNINTLNNNVIFGETDIHIYGLTELEVNEFGLSYKVNNRSFMQVNDKIKLEIYQKIVHEIQSDEIVIDAYSGAGLLSAIIAKKARQVYGIEIVKEATENAEFLKKSNNLNNLINLNGDSAKLLPKLAKEILENFVVVLDPPRKGVDKKVIDAIIDSEPKKVIYLSCNPATLARDLGLLKESYDISFVQPYDMFPQTANVETLVVLKKSTTK